MSFYSVTVRVPVGADVPPGQFRLYAPGLRLRVKLRTIPGMTFSTSPRIRPACSISYSRALAERLIVTMNVVLPAGRFKVCGEQPVSLIEPWTWPTDGAATGWLPVPTHDQGGLEPLAEQDQEDREHSIPPSRQEALHA
jgi:hypothetical protein